MEHCYRSGRTRRLSAVCQQMVGTGADRRPGMTAAGTLFALPEFGTSHWHDEIRIYLAQFWVWGALTPAIVWLDRRLPYSGRALGRRLAAHILASIVFTEIYFYVFTTMRALMGVAPWSSLRISQLFSPAVIGWQIWCWLIYWSFWGAYRPTSTTSAT